MRIALALLLLVTSTPGGGALAWAGGQRGADELAREILAERRYQTELPGGRVVREPRSFPWEVRELLVFIGWVLVGIAIALVVAWGIARWRERTSREVELREKRKARAPAPVTLTARPLEEAERLAREGRYGEATRLLLQLTFEALRDAGAVRLEPWRTGRRIARGARLSSAGRSALGELVRAVELAVFAGREPSGEEYERCAGRYRALLELARRGAA